MKRTIGIIGGMGPLATCDLYNKIISCTDAVADTEHVHVIIDSNNSIPDRTAAILNGGTNPVPAIAKSARRLERAGADVLIMPCNTAHYFFNEIQDAVKIPFLHMIRETALELKAQGIKKVGLLATNGTLRTGIYDDVLTEYEIEYVKPESSKNKHAIMGVVYDSIKAGNYSYDTTEFSAAVDSLLVEGAQCLILGCIELPPAFEIFGLNYPYIDPGLTLAKAAVKFAGYQVKK